MTTMRRKNVEDLGDKKEIPPKKAFLPDLESPPPSLFFFQFSFFIFTKHPAMKITGAFLLTNPPRPKKPVGEILAFI